MLNFQNLVPLGCVYQILVALYSSFSVFQVTLIGMFYRRLRIARELWFYKNGKQLSCKLALACMISKDLHKTLQTLLEVQVVAFSKLVTSVLTTTQISSYKTSDECRNLLCQTPDRRYSTLVIYVKLALVLAKEDFHSSSCL